MSQAEIDAAAAPSLRDGRVENQPGVVVDLLVERMTQRMDESYKEFQRDGYGQNATASLLAIVASLAPLPGRKTLVFFAEDFAVPDAAVSRLQAIIDTANRANVAIYTVDVAGLRVHSGRAETSREVAALARRGVGDDDRDASQPYTRDLERNEDVLRQDPSAGLGLLARQTGGLLIDGTNNLTDGFRRIDADRRFHYLLTYVPANTRFQGEFRRIEVRISRPRVEVRARPGYVASPEPTATPAFRYEAPTLAALAALQRPRDVALRGRAFVFPRPDGLSDVAVVVVLKAGDAGHWVDTASQRYRTDFTVLARLVDANGAVVWKGSQPYVLQGAVADVDRARAGDVVFFRQTALPGGTYTLAYVIHDELTHKAGTGAEPVVVEAGSDGALEVGSLVVVRGVESVADADRQADNPLHVGPLVLTPNVGEPVIKSRSDHLSFYVRVRSPISALTATLELRHSDIPLAAVTVPSPERDPDGSLRYLATVPLVNVAPGPCELRLTIADGATTVMRSAAFILER